MRRAVGEHGIYFAVFALFIVLGRLTRLTEDGIALWWPASGVALLWVLHVRGGRSLVLCLGLIGVTAGVVNGVTEFDPLGSIFLGLANASFALGCRGMSVFLDRQGAGWSRPSPILRVPQDLAHLVLTVVAGVLVGLPLAMVTFSSADLPVSTSWVVQWVTRNFVGAFAVTGLWLTFIGRPLRRKEVPPRQAEPARRWRWIEGGALVALTLVAVSQIFATDQDLPLSFLVIALAAWAGARFSPSVSAAYAVGAVVSAAVLFTIGAGGPLQGRAPFQSVLVIQSLGSVALLVALFLSLAIQEKDMLARSLEAAERKAHARADLLDTITDALVDGLVVLDGRGRPVLFNRAAELLVGGSWRDEGATLDPDQFSRVDGSPLPADERPQERARQGLSTTGADVLHTHQGTGQRRVLSVSAAPVGRGTDESEPLVVLLLRDVTARHQQLQQLQTFAGMVAHDLQNPLFAAKGWAEMASDRLERQHSSDTGATSALARVTSSLGRAQTLVDDLLGFTNASTNALTPDSVDLDELLEREMAELRVRYHQPDAVLEKRTLGEVCMDPTLGRQLFANLLGNALKYVDAEMRPHVVASRRSEGDQVVIEIADNGLGIPEAEKAHVFDAFYRVHKDFPGTGLGLAICAQAVERHGGSITVGDNPTGTGTVFAISLPENPAGDGSPEATHTGAATHADPHAATHDDAPDTHAAPKTAGAAADARAATDAVVADERVGRPRAAYTSDGAEVVDGAEVTDGTELVNGTRSAVNPAPDLR